MTQGNVMSWLAGILLGLVLGIALLIVANAGAPSAKVPTSGSDGAAVTADASVNEAAQKGNTPETAGVSQGSQGGQTDSATNANQESAPTVGDPATTAGGDAGDTTASGDTTAAAGDSGAATDASGAAASSEGQSGDAAAAGATADAGNAAGDAAAGKQFFSSTCGGCHGPEGQGAIGPAMNAHASGWDLAGFTQTLREGKTPDGRELSPTMPRFSDSQVSDQDIANIHAWVQSL